MKIKTAIMLIAVVAMVGCVSTTWRGAAIRERLADTPGLGTHDIAIDEREGGEIVLNGTVSSDQDRDVIERVARHTSGVKEVRNNLVVTPSSVVVREGDRAASNDARALVSEIMAELSSSPDIRDYNLNVELVGDTIILRGEVDNERARAAAERIALDTRGVTRVSNEIRVTGNRYGQRYYRQY